MLPLMNRHISISNNPTLSNIQHFHWSPPIFWKYRMKHRKVSHIFPEIVIHVITWKRSRSLNRLLNSLLNAEYFGNRVSLNIHVDGNPSEHVLNILDKFYWPFGEKKTDYREEHFGLAGMMQTIWPNSTDSHNRVGIFFEDDIEVSPYYFMYVLYCIRQFYHRETKEKIFGCALHTPRVNEVVETNDPKNPPLWNPSIITADSFVLYQMPCSWGALYFSDPWHSFVQNHLNIRLKDPTEKIISGLRIHKWNNSWKKYLVEFFVENDFFMLYPNHPNQASYSTNHFELGLHTEHGNGNEDGHSEVLRSDANWVDYRFTVPLLGDWKIIAETIYNFRKRNDRSDREPFWCKISVFGQRLNEVC